MRIAIASPRPANTTSSPGWMPCLSRIALGMTTWPLGPTLRVMPMSIAMLRRLPLCAPARRAPRCGRRPRRATGRSCRARRRRALRQRRVLAGGVALVADRLLGEHGPEVGADLLGAPARALLGAGGEEDLHRGVGRDDGADVAPLGDPVAVGDEPALLGDERLAHGRVGGDARGRLGDLGRADRLGHVAPVEQHAFAELDPQRRRDLGRRAAAARRPRAPRSGTSRPSRGR